MVCLRNISVDTLHKGDDDDDDDDDDNDNNNNNNIINAIGIWQLNTVYIIPLVQPTTAVILNKLHYSLKLLNLRPAVYIPLQPAAILITCSIVRKFLAEW
jgi:hypothetical protein